MSPELTLYFIWLLWGLSWAAATLWAARTIQPVPRGSQLANRFFLALGVALLFGILSPRRMAMLQLWRLDDEWKWALDGVIVLGFAFSWWGRAWMGWPSSSQPQLVQTGPYHFLRHPAYAGIIIAAFATAALQGTLLGVVGASVMTLGWYLKARLEEDMLREILGQPYDDYMAQVPMFIPFAKP